MRSILVKTCHAAHSRSMTGRGKVEAKNRSALGGFKKIKESRIKTILQPSVPTTDL